jgi:hypothetical protein
MKKQILISIVLTAALITAGCEKETWNDPTRVSGQGEVVTESLNLNPFSRIILEGVANLYISVGEEGLTVLKAQQNIIDVLRWSVSSGTLTIGLKDGVTLHKHEEIRFEINALVMNDIVHDGVGDMYLEGDSQDELELDFRGVGNVFAYGLPVNTCTVLNSGTGDCKVSVNELLEVDISSIGNVYYRGNPEITCNDSGMGELVNDN